ncbi:MAG: hypothetical protein KA297_11470 [Kofleriaceae bacterium]|nr:hypothetical protein [Kofleriaceae bacterium]MBP6836986.1 hypothetical protein [Kofleriaceae bacterium]
MIVAQTFLLAILAAIAMAVLVVGYGPSRLGGVSLLALLLLPLGTLGLARRARRERAREAA